MPWLPPSLDEPGEIMKWISEHMQLFQEVLAIETTEPGRRNPIGFVALYADQHRFDPHSVWLPWARPREKLEAAVRFLDKERRQRWGVITVPESDKAWMDHLVRYALVRPVGKYLYHPGFAGKKSYGYETVTPKGYGPWAEA